VKLLQKQLEQMPSNEDLIKHSQSIHQATPVNDMQQIKDHTMGMDDVESHVNKVKDFLC
jgi:hypothetical protein